MLSWESLGERERENAQESIKAYAFWRKILLMRHLDAFPRRSTSRLTKREAAKKTHEDTTVILLQ